MAGSVNKVILVGNVGRDPEIRTMQTGGRVASLSIATSDSWKDKSTGERREKTEWHRVAIFNDQLVGIVEKFVRKGTKLYIEGKLETRKWTDQNNQERYTTEVVLRQFGGELTLLDGAGGRSSDGSNTAGGDYAEPSYASSPRQETSSGQQRQAVPLDDDIPF